MDDRPNQGGKHECDNQPSQTDQLHRQHDCSGVKRDASVQQNEADEAMTQGGELQQVSSD